MPYKVEELSFTVSANGFADGPSQALIQYLNGRKAKEVVSIVHPLTADSAGEHRIDIFNKGSLVSHRVKRLPNKPPLTYLFDPLIPFSLAKSDAWFGFNNLACLRGLSRRRTGSTKKVFYWAVDFVPNRFGKGLATKAYNRVDRLVSRNVDARIELSKAALDARADYLGLDKKTLPPGIVVPMGAWLSRTAKTTDKSWQKKKIVYLGHLVERQGVGTLIKALAALDKRGVKFQADIIGSGPLENDLKKLAVSLKIKSITFHGFVKDHKDVEDILGGSTIAVAPYKKDKNSFTQFADPGKLKAYLGAGLPIVLTDVPPNAHELQIAGAAVIAQDTPESVARAIESLLDKRSWLKAQHSAIIYGEQFDWDVILKRALHNLGFD